MAKSRNRKKKKNPRKQQDQFSSINQHRRVGSTLQPRIPGVQKFDYSRDLVPELLWFDLFAIEFADEYWSDRYNDFLDRIEYYFDTEDFVLTGTLTDFGRVSNETRKRILSNMKPLLEVCFGNVMKDVLSLYPECPANWMIADLEPSGKSTEEILDLLKASLKRLYVGNDEHCGLIRMVPLGRYMQHKKIHLPLEMKGSPLVKFMLQYPNGSKDEKAQVEAFSRTTITPILAGLYDGKETHTSKKWLQYFWQRNFEISDCEIDEKHSRSPSQNSLPDFVKQLPEICETQAQFVDNYIQRLQKNYPFDIYDPSKDEVVIGLYARISRLTKSLLADSTLWSSDLSKILLRCIVDSAITLGYLIKQDDQELFDKFIEYGQGKDKLLMLQLQDNYQESLGPSGESIEDLEHRLGGFHAEFQNIELGHWANVNTRKMALDIGFGDLYRLVFDPTSSDVHGSWTSLRNINLSYCRNPLHRYHRLPVIHQPPFYVETLSATVEIYNRVLEYCIEHWKFPETELMENRIEVLIDEHNSD